MRAYLWRISLVVMTALAGVLVFVADGAGALQFALEVGFDRGAGIAGRADYDLDAALVKYLDGAAAMPPAMMTCTPLSARKFGRKPACGRIGDGFLGRYHAAIGVVEVEVVAVSEMAGHRVSHSCNCDFHNFYVSLSLIFRSKSLMALINTS